MASPSISTRYTPFSVCFHDRAATPPGRRSVEKEWQATWLLRAVTLIDLATLSGGDTPGRVRRLCAKAAQPVRQALIDAFGMPPTHVGAVCVYRDMVAPAVEALRGAASPSPPSPPASRTGRTTFLKRDRDFD